MFKRNMGGSQNYGPFLGIGAVLYKDPKRDHNFDNHQYAPYIAIPSATRRIPSFCALFRAMHILLV